MKKIIYPILFLNILFSQVSVSQLDINRIANSQLDDIKNQLKSNNVVDDAVINDSNKDIESIPVTINELDIVSDNDEYFGYNYFKSEINFFDNIPTPNDFKLGAGDEIVISLWGETNSREKFIINKEGLIYYENVGFINLSNKTIAEAENLLVNELSKIYSTLNESKNPTKLMLELGKLKSLNIYFSGEIFKPGIQLIHPFSDIFSSLIQAGGIKKEGSLRKIHLIRKGETIAVIDFYNFFNEGSNDFSNLRLIDGDVIHVPSIQDRVKINGAVLRPGFYEVLPEDNLNSLINYAAGLKSRASSIITIDTVLPFENRDSQDNIISSINIDLSEKKQISINNGDVVTIREIGSSDSKVEIFGRVKVPGKYSAINMTLRNILDFAGGFDDPIYRKSINNEIVVLRKDENQFYSLEYKVLYNESESFKLKVDDKIFVYEDINYRNSFIYRVEGEVNKPGTYPLKKGITIIDAINSAGGLTELTSLNNIILEKEEIITDEDGVESTVVRQIARAPLSFELTNDLTIKALAINNTVKVEGNVYNPGLVAHTRGMTMYQAIEKAGGYKPYSIKKRAYVQRSNGEIEKANIFRGRSKRILPGDTIVVPVDPNPQDFNITAFVADLATTFANIAAILLIIENQSD